MLLLALLAACATNIHSQYEAERDAVLAELPAPSAPGWSPELEARVAPAVLQTLAEAALDGGIGAYKKKLKVDNPFGVDLSVRPKASIKNLKVRVGADCGGCLSVTAKIKGTARWTAGPLDGSIPFSGTLGGQLRFTVEPQGEGWVVTGKLAKLDTLKLDRAKAAKVDLTPFLGDWTRDAVKKAPPLRLGEFGGAGLPLRGLRLDGADGMLLIQGLTDVPGAVPVGAAPALEGDWDLRLHEDTVAALVRRTAFRAGPLAYDTAADPRALDLKGGAFTMELRLWRLSGMGWWRDYTVAGKLDLTAKGKLRLRSTGAEEGAKSKGAGLADPIALIAEGRILEEVGSALRTTVPAARKAKVGDHTVSARTTRARGVGNQLVLGGTLGIVGQ